MASTQEQADFYKIIDDLVWEKDISYLDALLLYCSEHDLEIVVAAELTNQALKIKLEEDADKLKLLKKKGKLF